jgi:hypothetical protein
VGGGPPDSCCDGKTPIRKIEDVVGDRTGHETQLGTWGPSQVWRRAVVPFAHW